LTLRAKIDGIVHRLLNKNGFQTSRTPGVSNPGPNLDANSSPNTKL